MPEGRQSGSGFLRPRALKVWRAIWPGERLVRPEGVRQKQHQAGEGFSPMRSIAFADFLIGVGILFVIEGLLFTASPAWMRRAMQNALETPDNILRAVGIGSAVAGLILIWAVRR
jgi:uncharacterized protein